MYNLKIMFDYEDQTFFVIILIKLLRVKKEKQER